VKPQVVASLVGDGADGLADLSDRDRLIAEGLTNSGIAQRLLLTDRTVDGHVRIVLMNLRLTGRRGPTNHPNGWSCVIARAARVTHS
jgi:DNA-binding NarL/FixJ family response regulator